MESRRLLTRIVVDSTGDGDGADGSGTLSLRQAIEISNGTLQVGSLTQAQQALVSGTSTTANAIDFAIPAAEFGDASHSVAVPGFDPTTQTWTIAVNSPLPTITHQVTIDGYTEGQTPIAFRYPNQLPTQTLAISGGPTGGTFTLTTSAPLPVGKTAPIRFNASAAEVQAALAAIVDKSVNGVLVDSVDVFGGPFLPGDSLTIAFTGIDYANEPIPPLIPDASGLTGGIAPTASVVEVPETSPDEIVSTPNTVAATTGNNAVPRLIVEGSLTGGATGFVLGASDVILRGMVIDGFGVGVSVPNPGDVGDLIQGDDIGPFPLFPVDPDTGQAITVNGAPEEILGGRGNSLQAVLLASTNATVGGVETQDSNVIVANGSQGVSILAGAQGNQVVNNQIGILGPAATSGIYYILPNGSDGVRIADSSNYVGGATAGAGNLISGNDGDGVHLVGAATTRNNVLGNDIGVGPGGGFLFGSAEPGNVGDGVTIDDAGDNNIGGTAAADRNVISGNKGAGVNILGGSGVRNLVEGNYIGITVDGISALGNGGAGVAIASDGNIIGPSNVISANLKGVLINGVGVTGNVVQGNRIGTNATGTADLGNAEEGVLINAASGNSITGNAQGSQVISGNNVGLLISGSTAVGNQVLGNFVGTDVTGTLDLGNSQSGVEIANAPGNVIGGASATGRNLISANYWGVQLTGPQAIGNVVQGNFIGTGISGLTALGNELDGVYINQGASGNLIGGSSGNTVAFNRRDGVRIEGPSVRDAILTNSIFANLELGINLVPPGPNGVPNSHPPTLTAVASSIGATIISGMLTGAPNSAYTIQFFFSSGLDRTGVGEGGQFVGQATATTGADGIATYSANVPYALTSGQFVTATATDASGNTSEFSIPRTEFFGTVQFQMAGYVVSEGVGMATIVATRTGGSGGYFTVNYATADGTGLAGSAYQPAMGTLTFLAGEDAQTFTVPVLDNGQPEGDVTVLLGLSDPVGPISLGAPSSAVLTILGNQPGAFQFPMASFAVDQAAGTATITVTRDQGGLASTVNYATADGTAVAGTDYTPTAGTLTFAPGVLSQSFTVPILLNTAIKSNLTVLLNLSSPTNGALLGSPSSAVLVIVDDGVNRMGPEVTGVRAVSGPVGTAEVVVSFNEPLDPSTAVDLLNYGYSVRTAGRDRKLGTKDDKLVGITSATYDPNTLTVTLPLEVAVPVNTPLLLQINEATSVAGAGVGVSDLLGNLLDGDGHPGSPYSATVHAEPVPSPKKPPATKSGGAKAVKPKPAPKAHPHGPSTSKSTKSAHHG